MSLTMKTFDVLINNYRIQYIREINSILHKHGNGFITAPAAMLDIGEAQENYDLNVRELIETFDDKKEQQEAYYRYMNSLGF